MHADILKDFAIIVTVLLIAPYLLFLVWGLIKKAIKEAMK